MPKLKDESQAGILKCKRKKLWLDATKHGILCLLKIDNTLHFQVSIENWPYISPQKNLNKFWTVIIQATFPNHNIVKLDLLTLSQNKGPSTQK